MADQRIIDELLKNQLDLIHQGIKPPVEGRRLTTDELVDVLRHGDLLATLLTDEPLDRRDIEATLGVSRATSHRFTHWLEEKGYATRADGAYVLTGRGAVAAEAFIEFERKLRTADRLAPLLEFICEEHEEFVVEPFSDAVVTVATPANPYAPVTRLLALLRQSDTFRGFNTTHVFPPGFADVYGDLFAGRDVELIYLPDVVEGLREQDPERFEAALDAGHLTLLTRDALPYGLALFDDRVGIGGYDEETGAMKVFVDADTLFAREWASRAYETFKRDSVALA